MPRPLRSLSSVLVFTVLLLSATFSETADRVAREQVERPIVILVSIDGWRWDYLERFSPPVLSRLARAGVTAEALIPAFPSKTFPNHYTIVTGLYPARHGIVSNNMVDPALPRRFSLDDFEAQQDTRWWQGEPLWNTAERQGQIAGTLFWPGSDAVIGGRRPTFFEMYNHELPNEARIETLLVWLRQSEPVRPRFLTLYFSDVDTAGHDSGPETEETRKAALGIDAMIGRLAEGVERLGLAPRVNYVFVSDHGMSALSRTRVIVLDDYIDLSTVDVIDSSPIVGLSPRPGVSAESIYRALRGKHPSLDVYTRNTLPEEYRLRDHPRLPEVIGIADDGWHVTSRRRLDDDERRGRFPGGAHGYDSKHRSMHGLFIASGPRFKSGLTVSAFANVHVYELLCRLLGVTPAPNDGDPAVTAAFLR